LPPIDLIDGRSCAVRSTGIALALLMFLGLSADAGVFSRFWDKQQESMFSRKNWPREQEVPGGRPNLVAPNGVEVPAWASKRMRESRVPLYGPSWGRRPWAYALSHQATPSAAAARSDQLGFGAGPVPGYTNDYGGAGNYPMASVGKDTVNGWGPAGGLRSLVSPNPNRWSTGYPWTTGMTGY
jgi:hypothetical protein